MITILNTVYELFLHILILRSPTSLISLLKESFVFRLEIFSLTKEYHFFMKITLRKDGVFLTIDKAFKYFWHVPNIFEHFFETGL